MTTHKGPIEGKHFELNGNEQRAGMSSVPELSPDGWPPQLPWKYDRSELLADALVHAVGSRSGSWAVSFLSLHAFHSTQESITAAFLIYAVGLIPMLGDLGGRTTSTRCVVPSGCFAGWTIPLSNVLIAATYRPFLATMASASLLAAVWLVAIGGVLKLLLPGRLEPIGRSLTSSGLGGGGCLSPVIGTLTGSTLWLIAAGGVLYPPASKARVEGVS